MISHLFVFCSHFYSHNYCSIKINLKPHQHRIIKNNANMADLNRTAFWEYEQSYTFANVNKIHKITFDIRHKVRSKVTPCNGSHGLEFLYSLTLPEFEQANHDQGWGLHAIRKVLGRQYEDNLGGHAQHAIP